MPNKTRERAREIINVYLQAVAAVESVKSVILVGSLSDGTYTGNLGSDIDLVHIVYDRYDYETEKQRIVDLISRVESETNNDVPISRTVFSEKHLLHPYTYDFDLCVKNKDLIERPIELFRILDSGKLLYGEDVVPTLERPTREDMLESIKLNRQWTEILSRENPGWYAASKEMRKHPTIRIMTQIVITTAMSDYYFLTGKSCSSKYRILELAQRDLPGLSYLNLLKLCIR